MSSITVNLSQFALGLGNAERITLEASTPFHKAYHKADDEGQAAMKLEFITSFVQGNLNITPEKAAKIVALKRVERSAKDELAVNAAGAKFRYHLVREVSGARAEIDLLAKAVAAYAKLTPAQKRKFAAQM
jgi:hypothetical protein